MSEGIAELVPASRRYQLNRAGRSRLAGVRISADALGGTAAPQGSIRLLQAEDLHRSWDHYAEATAALLVGMEDAAGGSDEHFGFGAPRHHLCAPDGDGAAWRPIAALDSAKRRRSNVEKKHRYTISRVSRGDVSGEAMLGEIVFDRTAFHLTVASGLRLAAVPRAAPPKEALATRAVKGTVRTVTSLVGPRWQAPEPEWFDDLREVPGVHDLVVDGTSIGVFAPAGGLHSLDDAVVVDVVSRGPAAALLCAWIVGVASMRPSRQRW